MALDHCLLLKEVADVLAEHGDLRCAATLDHRGERLVLAVEIDSAAQPDATAFDRLELYNALRYVADVATMRALCLRYGIAPGLLEARLPPREEVP